jgi:L-2-hydroxycarboxylate dehydrogenase (NAD+)
MIMKPEEIEKLALGLLVKHGLKPEEATIVAKEILDAEMRGRHAHGVELLPTMIERMKERTGEIRVIRDSGFSALVDGGDNLGPLVADLCSNLAISKAQSLGVSIVGAVNKFVFVTGGYHARKIAENNLIAIIFSAAEARVAPWGGIDRIFGTNPVAVGIPSKQRPIVLDMALSRKAAAEIRLAKKLGEKIDKSWAVDQNGNPTDDPDEALKGALLPIDTYKGYGLALVVEILGGLFVGGKAGNVVKGRRGMAFIALKPNTFVDLDKFKQDVSLLVSEIKASRKARGFDEILIPGEKSDREFEKAKSRGIEVSEKFLDNIKGL